MKKSITTGGIVSAQSEADAILFCLREATDVARKLEAEFTIEMDVLRQLYEVRINTAKETLAILASDLEAFAKSNKSALFPKEDTRLELQNGALIYTVEKRVKRIRKMLERLEKAGRNELIKTAKSVDWDSVEKLDDAALKALGTKRQTKERFAYEIKA